MNVRSFKTETRLSNNPAGPDGMGASDLRLRPHTGPSCTLGADRLVPVFDRMNASRSKLARAGATVLRTDSADAQTSVYV